MSARRPLWRRAAGPGLLPVLLVLICQLILPPGVMPAPGPGLPIVLCTGHGPANYAPHAPADRRHDGGAQHACPFAHHGLSSAAPDASPLQLTAARYDAIEPSLPAATAPGRRLPAPPPPSHAPPTTLRT